MSAALLAAGDARGGPLATAHRQLREELTGRVLQLRVDLHAPTEHARGPVTRVTPEGIQRGAGTGRLARPALSRARVRDVTRRRGRLILELVTPGSQRQRIESSRFDTSVRVPISTADRRRMIIGEPDPFEHDAPTPGWKQRRRAALERMASQRVELRARDLAGFEQALSRLFYLGGETPGAAARERCRERLDELPDDVPAPDCGPEPPEDEPGGEESSETGADRDAGERDGAGRDDE